MAGGLRGAVGASGGDIFCQYESFGDFGGRRAGLVYFLRCGG